MWRVAVSRWVVFPRVFPTPTPLPSHRGLLTGVGRFSDEPALNRGPTWSRSRKRLGGDGAVLTLSTRLGLAPCLSPRAPGFLAAAADSPLSGVDPCPSHAAAVSREGPGRSPSLDREHWAGVPGQHGSFRIQGCARARCPAFPGQPSDALYHPRPAAMWRPASPFLQILRSSHSGFTLGFLHFAPGREQPGFFLVV